MASSILGSLFPQSLVNSVNLCVKEMNSTQKLCTDLLHLPPIAAIPLTWTDFKICYKCWCNQGFKVRSDRSRSTFSPLVFARIWLFECLFIGPKRSVMLQMLAVGNQTAQLLTNLHFFLCFHFSSRLHEVETQRMHFPRVFEPSCIICATCKIHFVFCVSTPLGSTSAAAFNAM